MDRRRIVAVGARVMSIASLLGTLCAVLLAPPRVARAQARGFAVNRFEPSERGSDWFANESLDLRGNGRPATGVVLDWAYRPFRLYDPKALEGPPRADVITDQIVVHSGAAIVFRDRYRFAMSVPVTLFQHGEDVSSVAVAARAPEKAAIGDVRLSSDVRVLGTYGAKFSAAIGAQVFLPTGNRALFTGDGTVRVAPRLLVAGALRGFQYAARVSFMARPAALELEGRQLGSEIAFSAAAGMKVNDRFVFGPELWGSTVVTGGDAPFRTRNTPLEMLIGGHLSIGDHWQAGSAIGPGLTRGDGAPTMRVLLSLEFSPDVCVDKDGDGICADEDACPDVDGVRVNHGCPADRDHDGFTDAEDACPDVGGVKTGYVDTTGCPDRDGDGVADRVDECPDEPGSAGQDGSPRGCPAPTPPDSRDPGARPGSTPPTPAPPTPAPPTPTPPTPEPTEPIAPQ